MAEYGHKSGDWKPSYTKCKPGQKRKSLTLYACSSCKGRGYHTKEDVKGFRCTGVVIWSPCFSCNQTGKNKRIASVKEKDYYNLMEKDRQQAGMKFKRRN